MRLGIRRTAGICCLIQGVLLSPALQNAPLAQTSLKAYPTDGVPIRAERCGHNTVGQGWVTRDLGQGVNVEVGIFYEQEKQISVTLLFRFWDGELELSPEGIRLNVFPNERIYKASGVRRATYKSKDERCAPHGEWLHLSFPVEPGNLGQVALVFPDDAVVRGNSIIRVRPFRFERTGDSGTGGSTPPSPLTITAAPTAQERLKSCDPAVVLGAAEEILANKSTLREPLQMFLPAITLYQYGRKDEAVFWFYAAQLRTRYQLVFEPGRGNLLGVMMTTTGEPINNYAFQDIAKLGRILDRVLEWDRKTPNPFRDRPRTEVDEKEVQKIYSGLRDLKAKLVAEKDDLENKARAATPFVQGIFVRGANESRAKHCPGSAQQAIREGSAPPQEPPSRVPPGQTQSPASAKSAADALAAWGLLGTWSVDCSRSADSSNMHVTYGVRTDGSTFFSRNLGAGNRDNSSVDLESASIEPGGMIVLRATFSGKRREWGLVKLPKGRVRTSFAREVGGDYSVRDGRVVSTGTELPWVTLCR